MEPQQLKKDGGRAQLAKKRGRRPQRGCPAGPSQTGLSFGQVWRPFVGELGARNLLHRVQPRRPTSWWMVGGCASSSASATNYFFFMHQLKRDEKITWHEGRISFFRTLIIVNKYMYLVVS